MIIGSESEWYITAVKNGEVSPDFFNIIRFVNFYRKCIGPPLIPRNIDFNPIHSLFLTNGARLYIDTGSHIEYASCEADSALRAVITEKAGERIMERAIMRANMVWKKEGWEFRLYKCNLDNVGNSFGSHESYSIDSGENISFLEPRFSFLEGFFVSRILFGGNGWEDWVGDKPSSFLSQRATQMTSPLGGQTTNNRPIINDRDQPQADSGRFRRLHLIIGDGLLLEAALWLKFGTTAKAVDLAFSRYLASSPLGIIQNPNDFVSALKVFNEDPELRKTFTFNGKSLVVAHNKRLPKIGS